jgi:hypothetical protein
MAPAYLSNLIFSTSTSVHNASASLALCSFGCVSTSIIRVFSACNTPLPPDTHRAVPYPLPGAPPHLRRYDHVSYNSLSHYLIV